MVEDTACGAAAPSSETPSLIPLMVMSPVQVRPSAIDLDGTPAAVEADGDGDAEAEVAAGLAKKSNCVPIARATMTMTAMPPIQLSRLRRFTFSSCTVCRAW